MIFCIVGIAWSAIAAPAPWRALWSTHNRQEGAWQAAHYVALTLVLAAMPREKLVRWVAVAALGAAAGGLAPFGWGDGRLGGGGGGSKEGRRSGPGGPRRSRVCGGPAVRLGRAALRRRSSPFLGSLARAGG